MDQENLWRSPNTDQGDADLLKAPILALSCPSRRPPTVWLCDNISPHLNWPTTPVDKRLQFLIDYAGNAGLSSSFHTPQGVAQNPVGVIVPRTWPAVKNSSVNRGMSAALLAGEKYVPISAYEGGDIGDDVSGYYTYKEGNIRYGDAGPYPDGPAPAQRTNPTLSSDTRFFPFGSAHPVAMNAVFCDGSVRTIRYDNPLLPTICDRTNKTPVNLDDL